NAAAGFSATLGTGGTLTVTKQGGGAFDAAASNGAGSFAGALDPERYGRVAFVVPVSGTVHSGASWTLTLTGSGSAAVYSYVAGAHGEQTQPASMDVRLTDDDAPGVLVLQSGDSTNVTEPSEFVV